MHTILPSSKTGEAYDKHAFSKRVKVVGKHSGLTYNDFTGTTVKTARSRNGRWLNGWSGNPNHIRQVVGIMVWGCATGTHGAFPQEEYDTLGGLRFVQKYENRCRDNAATLYSRPGKGEQQLRERDTQRRVGIFGYAKLLTSAIHYAYGLGYTSAQVSDALTVRVSPTAIRQWLYRCNLIARELWPELCAKAHWSHKGKLRRKPHGGKRGLRGPRRPDLVMKIFPLHAKGMTCQAIAKAIGWDYGAVKHQLETRGLFVSTQKRVSPAVFAEVAMWYRAGVRVTHIAEALGFHPATLHLRLKKAGLLVRRKARRK